MALRATHLNRCVNIAAPVNRRSTSIKFSITTQFAEPNRETVSLESPILSPIQKRSDFHSPTVFKLVSRFGSLIRAGRRFALR